MTSEIERIKHGGSHLPALVWTVQQTVGPILELGLGYNSTPYLHWASAVPRRQLVSYENNPAFYPWAQHYNSTFHQVLTVDDWKSAQIEHPWDVALVDHNPAEKRANEVLRLAAWAKYIIVHDTDWKLDKGLQWSPVWPQFKQRVELRYTPQTTIVSNLVDLKPLYNYFREFGAPVHYEAIK